MKIKDLVIHAEIYSCLICDNTCGYSAMAEGLTVVFHVCFNCVTLGVEVVKSLSGV